jgi:hypothetical protein
MGIGSVAATMSWYEEMYRCVRRKREEVLRSEFRAPQTVLLKMGVNRFGADIAGFQTWRITRCFTLLGFSQKPHVRYHNASARTVPEHIEYDICNTCI